MAKTKSSTAATPTTAPAGAAPAPAPAKPARKAAARPAAKAAAKPAKAPAKPAAKAGAKPAVKPVAKRAKVPQAPLAAAPAAAPAKASKPAKPKLVRDSFTIPKDEYQVLDRLKIRAVGLQHPVKKSELLRAGIQALAAMPDREFVEAIAGVPTLKTGRPKAD